MHGTLSSSLSPSSPQALPRYSHIVAIDLGKFNSVLCRFDPATAAHSFVSLATNREAITRELDPVAIADRSTIGKNIGESAKRGMTSINQLRIINGQLLITRSNE